MQLVTGGHDGAIKTWDVRKLSGENESALICSVENAHQSKYNEAVQCIQAHSTTPFIATGGADSLIKVFEL
jgi:striatin 1/3/4